MTPSVSVIMAAHRHDPYIDKAAASILAQSFEDFELIIVANAAPDAFVGHLTALQSSDLRIRLVRIPLPGLANALNHGLSLARGELVARMDADDISLPDRLAFKRAAMVDDPRLAVVGCRSDLIDARGDVIGEFPFFGDDRSIRRALPYRNPLLHPCLMMRKSTLISIGGYRYGHMSEDHEMFIRLARDSSITFKNIDDRLFQHRRHAGQITSVDSLKRHYPEVAGFLVTEFLFTHNPMYLVGTVVLHPWVRSARMMVRATAKALRSR